MYTRENMYVTKMDNVKNIICEDAVFSSTLMSSDNQKS